MSLYGFQRIAIMSFGVYTQLFGLSTSQEKLIFYLTFECSLVCFTLNHSKNDKCTEMTEAFLGISWEFTFRRFWYFECAFICLLAYLVFQLCPILRNACIRNSKHFPLLNGSHIIHCELCYFIICHERNLKNVPSEQSKCRCEQSSIVIFLRKTLREWLCHLIVYWIEK